MNFPGRKIYNRLAFRLAAGAFSVAVVVGLSFYFFVLNPISRYSAEQIRNEVLEASLDLYNICHQSFSDLQHKGYLDDERHIRIAKGHTLGFIDALAQNKDIYIFIREGERDIFEPDGIMLDSTSLTTDYKDRFGHSLIELNSKQYYIEQEEFPPWNWHLIVLKDTEAYTSLFNRINFTYTITFTILFLGTLLAVYYLNKSIKKPIMDMISSIEENRTPDYKGIAELEFVNDNLKKALAVRDKEINLINEIYKLAALKRGEDFFEETVCSLSRMFGLHCIITTLDENKESEKVLAMPCNGKLTLNNTVFTLADTPSENVYRNKRTEIIEHDVWKKFMSAEMLTNVKADTFVGAPILDRDGEVFGVINLFGEHKNFSDSDQKILKTIAQIISRELEHIEEEENKLQLMQKVNQVQRLESIGILAGGIAHDFNNLLTAIMGNMSMASIFLDKDDKVYEYIEATEKASKRAKGLTRQLLTFAKGGEPVTKSVCIKDVVKDSALFVLCGSNVRAEFQIPDDLWPVEADINQFGQVIQNLVKNADQGMTQGGTINISLENIALGEDEETDLPAGRYVRIKVTDQGEGIPEIHLPRIFEPYFTTRKQGSGLGLAVVYSIINKHNGTITAESKPGKGTTFIIDLSVSDKVPTETITLDTHRLQSGNEKILVMDDEKAVLKTIFQMLTHLGYEIDLAEEGSVALEMYADKMKNGCPYAALILDLTVPGGMGGLETLHKILDLDAHAKAIVTSGYSDDPIMADYEKYGFRGVVEKPFQMKELNDTLTKVLSL